MSILDLIAQGKIQGFNEVPRLIVTTVSRIFIFKNDRKVLKVYRRDNDYWNTNFADISNGPSRIKFIHDDFKTNKDVDPEIYVDLKNAVVQNNEVILAADDGKNDELIIVMNYADTDESFNDRVFQGEIPPNQFQSIGRQFALAKKHIDIGKEKPNQNWYELMEQRIPDLQIWMEELTMDKDVIYDCIQKLKIYTGNNKERFQNISGEKLVYTIDAHGENALYNNGKLSLLDIFLPSSHWFWTPKEYDLFRFGTDIYALSSEQNFNEYIKGVKEVYPDLDNTDKDFYLLYAAAIMMGVFFTIGHSKSEKKPIKEKYYTWFLGRLQEFKS